MTLRRKTRVVTWELFLVGSRPTPRLGSSLGRLRLPLTNLFSAMLRSRIASSFVLIVAALYLATRSASAADAERFELSFAGARPAAGASNVCPDTPLLLKFSTPPTLGSAGQIRIHDASNDAVVETIDLAATSPTRTVGGEPYVYYPVLIEGTEAIITPKTTLAYGRSYYVTFDAGVFLVNGKPSSAMTAQRTWRFSTKASAPAAGKAELVVAADGSGDFCTVQGAFDFVPAGNTSRVTILLREGIYREMPNLPRGKNLVTLRGADRAKSIISYANNARFNPRVRSVVDIYAEDFVLENLTVRNTTPRGGSQAEAIRVRSDRTRIEHCNFISLQDTLQLTGRVYVNDCYVEGDVDFVWGSGTVFFDRCELKALNNGYLVQSRNGANRLGYIFADCKLTATPNVARYILARIEPSRFPASHVAFLDCAMGSHVSEVAWQFDRAPNVTEIGPTEQIRFQEFRSTDLAGQPLKITGRHPASRQLSAEEAAKLRDFGHVFGNWNPRS